MEEKSLNLCQRIIKIMSEVGYVQKDGFNAFHKYKYVSEAAILDKLRDALVKYGVAIFPSVEEVTRHGDISSVKVSYELVNVDNPEDKKVVTWHGDGQDKGDKGIYKAFTGASKYFALKTFQISTGDDPEKDDDDKPTPPKKSKPIDEGYNQRMRGTANKAKPPKVLQNGDEQAKTTFYFIPGISAEQEEFLNERGCEKLGTTGVWKSPIDFGKKLAKFRCDPPEIVDTKTGEVLEAAKANGKPLIPVPESEVFDPLGGDNLPDSWK